MPKYTGTFEFEADDDRDAVEYARAVEEKWWAGKERAPVLVKLTTEVSYTYDRRVDLENVELALP